MSLEDWVGVDVRCGSLIDCDQVSFPVPPARPPIIEITPTNFPLYCVSCQTRWSLQPNHALPASCWGSVSGNFQCFLFCPHWLPCPLPALVALHPDFFPLCVPSFACVKCPALISFSFKTIPEISQCYWFTDGLMVPILVFHCCVVCLSHSSGTWGVKSGKDLNSVTHVKTGIPVFSKKDIIMFHHEGKDWLEVH